MKIVQFISFSSYLNLDKLPPALDGDLDERVARHVLDSLVGLVHELEQLVNNSLQEPPVGPKESWVLTHDVHDVRGNDGLVVFPLLLFTKAQEILTLNNDWCQFSRHN